MYKWNRFWIRFIEDKYRQEIKKAIYPLTAKIILQMLEPHREGKILDVGAGFADIDILLARNSDFEIAACDNSEIALKNAKKNIKKNGFEEKIKAEYQDAYNMTYADNEFDFAISTGYASAGAYPEVTEEIIRVVKPNGIIILDFVRHHNIWNFWKSLNALKGYWNYRKGGKNKYFHYGIFGIKQQFRTLEIEKWHNFHTFLPLPTNADFYLTFENTIGKILSPLLARAFIIKFRNRK